MKYDKQFLDLFKDENMMLVVKKSGQNAARVKQITVVQHFNGSTK